MRLVSGWISRAESSEIVSRVYTVLCILAYDAQKTALDLEVLSSLLYVLVFYIFLFILLEISQALILLKINTKKCSIFRDMKGSLV